MRGGRGRRLFIAAVTVLLGDADAAAEHEAEHIEALALCCTAITQGGIAMIAGTSFLLLLRANGSISFCRFFFYYVLRCMLHAMSCLYRFNFFSFYTYTYPPKWNRPLSVANESTC